VVEDLHWADGFPPVTPWTPPGELHRMFRAMRQIERRVHFAGAHLTVDRLDERGA
jgi:hypothetical protein